MENEISYKSLVRCIPNGMFMVDREKRIITWNSAAESIFGLKANEVLGKVCVDAFICTTSDGACPLFDENVEKPLMGHECRVALQHGREIVLLKNMELLKDDDGTIHGGIETFIDITGLKHMEAELLAAKKLAETALEAKGDFLANLSHEIRTPMNGIMGLLDLALETSMDNKQREYLHMAKCSSAALMYLLNDLLDFSKIETGRIRLASDVFDLKAMIHSAVDSQMAVIKKSGLTVLVNINGDVPALVHGDPARLRQIIVNLLGNALKFTDSGSITISVSVMNGGTDISLPESEGEMRSLRFSVSDTGIGIPEDKHHTIFNAFTQVDGSKNRNHGGMGLGLSICRHLVEMMGGSIDVRSRPGAGSTFYFTIPMLPANVVHPAEAVQNFEPSRRTIQNTGRSVIVKKGENSSSLSADSDKEKTALETLAIHIRERHYGQIEKQAIRIRDDGINPDMAAWSDDLFRIVLAARRKDDSQLHRLLKELEQRLCNINNPMKENRSCES